MKVFILLFVLIAAAMSVFIFALRPKDRSVFYKFAVKASLPIGIAAIAVASFVFLSLNYRALSVF